MRSSAAQAIWCTAAFALSASAAVAGVKSPACLRVVQPIPSGSVPNNHAFEPSGCLSGRAPVAVHYDRAHAVARATRDLSVGEIVRSFPGYSEPHVVLGDDLLLVVTQGPVRVERHVTALQTARPGQSLFVKSQDGEVFATEYRGDMP